MSQCAVLGAGHYLPPLIERAGVVRPIEDPPPGTSELGARASRAALQAAGLEPADVDFIVFATVNPDVTFPGSACYLQDKLGCDTVGALDVRAQCSGFVCATTVADQFIRNGQYRRILVVGAEIHSVWVDYSPAGAELARRFGDGAGAVLLGPARQDEGLLAAAFHTDGSRHDRFWCEYPASRQFPTRIMKKNLLAGQHYPKVDAADVAAFGREHLPAAIREVSAKARIEVDAVDHVVLSHLFPEVAEDASRALGLSQERTVIPSAAYGHLGGAALPLALSEGLQSGRFRRGSVICLAAAGAGYTWGAALFRL